MTQSEPYLSEFTRLTTLLLLVTILALSSCEKLLALFMIEMERFVSILATNSN